MAKPTQGGIRGSVLVRGDSQGKEKHDEVQIICRSSFCQGLGRCVSILRADSVSFGEIQGLTHGMG